MFDLGKVRVGDLAKEQCTGYRKVEQRDNYQSMSILTWKLVKYKGKTEVELSKRPACKEREIDVRLSRGSMLGSRTS